ncbi:MAG: hypothetical protein Q7S28_04140, partial [bacterium]|nr:hypothetical protein [bacterium]
MRKFFLFLIPAIFLTVSACTKTANNNSQNTVATPHLQSIYDEVMPGMTALRVTDIINRYAPNAPVQKFNQMGNDVVMLEWGTMDKNNVPTKT